jgi:hypothetical protein
MSYTPKNVEEEAMLAWAKSIAEGARKNRDAIAEKAKKLDKQKSSEDTLYWVGLGCACVSILCLFALIVLLILFK